MPRIMTVFQILVRCLLRQQHLMTRMQKMLSMLAAHYVLKHCQSLKSCRNIMSVAFVFLQRRTVILNINVQKVQIRK